MGKKLKYFYIYSFIWTIVCLIISVGDFFPTSSPMQCDKGCQINFKFVLDVCWWIHSNRSTQFAFQPCTFALLRSLIHLCSLYFFCSVNALPLSAESVVLRCIRQYLIHKQLLKCQSINFNVCVTYIAFHAQPRCSPPTRVSRPFLIPLCERDTRWG